MKLRSQILIIITLAFFYLGCKKEYVKSNSFSDVMYTTSSGSNNSGVDAFLKAQTVKGYFTISDLSQGVIFRKWSISGQDGLKFLLTGFNPAPTDTLSKIRHIMPDSVLSDKTINVFFQKAGTYTITWKDVFKDSCGYVTNGTVQDSTSKNWVFTKFFTVTIN